MISTFTKDNFIYYCNLLAEKDTDLRNIVDQYGYPPFWSRTPGFPTLIHIILEQQVSLASAKAAFLRLEAAIGHITPEKILELTGDQLKACYFSRQKTLYAKHLAEAIVSKTLDLESFPNLGDEEVSASLKKIKGIGNWTIDVFLMMALHRCDRFPVGDVALIKSIQEVKFLPPHLSKEEVLHTAGSWKPYRTIAAYLLWHAYLSKRKSPGI